MIQEFDSYALVEQRLFAATGMHFFDQEQVERYRRANDFSAQMLVNPCLNDWDVPYFSIWRLVSSASHRVGLVVPTSGWHFMPLPTNDDISKLVDMGGVPLDSTLESSSFVAISSAMQYTCSVSACKNSNGFVENIDFTVKPLDFLINS